VALAALAGAAGGGASAAAGAALLVAAVFATGLGTPLFAALLLLGAVYPEGGQAVPAPLYAAALLLLAELAFWWLDERDSGRVEPGTGVPRLLGILAVTGTGAAAGALVLLASEHAIDRSPAATAAGLAAILACLGLLIALARGLRGSS
jgi:hypothetical protein